MQYNTLMYIKNFASIMAFMYCFQNIQNKILVMFDFKFVIGIINWPWLIICLFCYYISFNLSAAILF